jgi:hypothetical protein
MAKAAAWGTGGRGQQPEPEFLNVYGAQEIDSNESIPPANLAWLSNTITLFLLGS